MSEKKRSLGQFRVKIQFAYSSLGPYFARASRTNRTIEQTVSVGEKFSFGNYYIKSNVIGRMVFHPSE